MIVTWLKASDGTAADDMAEALVTEWTRVYPNSRVSYQSAWAAGPVGTFKLQFTNAEHPAYNSTATDFPSSAMTTPTQPSGTASDNILCVQSIGLHCRKAYTPTSGGVAILPTTTMSFAKPGDQ